MRATGVLLVGGLACLVGATLVPGGPSAAPGDPAAGLGGLRTAVVGGMFLRGEALRREGRLDEAVALWQRMLALDPDAVSARDHLADVLAHDLRAAAPDDEVRVRRWRDAEALVDDGLARDPDAVRLLWRKADLLLVVPAGDAVVATALAAAGRDREREAIDALTRAARLAGDVPRLGRIHLELLARTLPRLAAQRLAARDASVDGLLRAGAEVLKARRDELDELVLDPEPPYVPASVVLQGGLALVAAVRAAVEARPPRLDEARRLLDGYVSTVGDDRVAEALRPLLR